MARTYLLFAAVILGWTARINTSFSDESNIATHLRPNILFIYTDDQAPTALGALGNDDIHTPNLDRLFQRSAILRNAMVTTPVCSPARASLLTSRYSSELGIFDWIAPREKNLGLDPHTITWVELLRDAGYHTGLIGKWHLGVMEKYHPRESGYDFFYGFRQGGCAVHDPKLEVDGKVQQLRGLTVDLLTDEALAFLDRNRASPFCLSLHYRSPHAPWLPVAPKDASPYEDLDPKLPDPDWPLLDTPLVKKKTREYYSSVTGVDRNVGRLLAKLKELKLDEQTIVIFTSDHGYNCGHNGIWYKGNAHWVLTETPQQTWPHIPGPIRPNLFDQSLRVPTAVYWPTVTSPGMVLDQVITNLDWFPTLLSMAGVRMPEEIAKHVRGHDFTPLLKREQTDWNNEAYFEYSMHHGAKTHMRAWRTPEWKLMIDLKNPGRCELYNLQADPTEKKNLFASTDPRVRSVRNQLKQRIHRKMGELGAPLAK